MTGVVLIDHSAYARLRSPHLPTDRCEEILGAMEDGSVGICLPFLLEAGYSARTDRDHSDDLHGLLGLPRFAIDESVEARALTGQSRLAASAHHRLPPMDLMIAAIADRYGLGVLHYDHDYDVIAQHTDLDFDSVWLAPRGSL